MKPSIAVSGGPSGVSEISGGASGDRAEQVTGKPVRGIYVLCSIVGYDHSEMHFVIDKTITQLEQCTEYSLVVRVAQSV
jgi:hypothetical protein